MPGPFWASDRKSPAFMKHVVGRRDGCNLGEGFHLAGPLFSHLENGMGVSHFLGLSSPHIL